jgi:flagellar basal-body rod protein FlgB
MGIAQLPLLTALTDKMRWHQARQTLLAENVANAETPGYQARELKPYSFEEHLRESSLAELTMSATAPRHFAISSEEGGGFSVSADGDVQVSPQGTAVNLEDEMMKVTANQMDYQTITTLYTRSLRLIRTALGHQA